jgi:hypothetical protein
MTVGEQPLTTSLGHRLCTLLLRTRHSNKCGLPHHQPRQVHLRIWRAVGGWRLGGGKGQSPVSLHLLLSPPSTTPALRWMLPASIPRIHRNLRLRMPFSNGSNLGFPWFSLCTIYFCCFGCYGTLLIRRYRNNPWCFTLLYFMDLFQLLIIASLT